MNEDVKELLCFLAVCVLLLIFLAAFLGGVAGLTVWIFWGFGIELPYWPTLGVWVLLGIVCMWLRGKGE